MPMMRSVPILQLFTLPEQPLQVDLIQIDELNAKSWRIVDKLALIGHHDFPPGPYGLTAPIEPKLHLDGAPDGQRATGDDEYTSWADIMGNSIKTDVLVSVCDSGLPGNPFVSPVIKHSSLPFPPCLHALIMAVLNFPDSC